VIRGNSSSSSGRWLVRDLLIIIPSRGRPGNVARFMRAAVKTCRVATSVVWAFDDDDPSLGKAVATAEVFAADFPVTVRTGPRKGLGAWTNEVATASVGEYRALGSFGDDHVPQTPGWDKLLLEAIEGMGGTGIAYPNDQVRDDVCEAWIESSSIVRALGWMCEPSLQHWWVDQVIHDLGAGAGCLKYLPEVLVPHKHFAAGKAQVDATYRDSGRSITADQAAYEVWREKRMAADVAAITALRAG